MALEQNLNLTFTIRSNSNSNFKRVTFPRNAMVDGDNSLRADFPLRHHRLFFCNARGIISGPLGAFVLFAVSEQSNRSLHIIACLLRMDYSLEWA